MAPPCKEAAVTKESKLALIIGFVLVLVVLVLVSDHFSQASTMTLDTMGQDQSAIDTPIARLGQREQTAITSAITEAPEESSARTPPEQFQPVVINQPTIIDDAIEQAKRRVQQTDLPAAAEPTHRDEPRSRRTRPLPAKTYHPYTVTEGDTLIGIARELLGDAERWREIESINADVLGPGAVLQIGMTLRLPADARILTNGKRQTTPTARTDSPARTYTVVAGDTLGEISMKLLGTSKRMNEIAQLNGLASPDQIFVGMTLKIPAK